MWLTGQAGIPTTIWGSRTFSTLSRPAPALDSPRGQPERYIGARVEAWTGQTRRVETSGMAPVPVARAVYTWTRARRGFSVLPWLCARWLKRALRVLLGTPLTIRIVVFTVVVVVVWSAVNWAYHVIRKPTELFFPVNSTSATTLPETRRQYAPLFRRHSTAPITPQLLAALAQVESSGDPVARTYWRWQLASNPFEVYRPASSAVGMYQITDRTFRKATRYC